MMINYNDFLGQFSSRDAISHISKEISYWERGKQNSPIIVNLADGVNSVVCATLLARELGNDRIIGIAAPRTDEEIINTVPLAHSLNIKLYSHVIEDEFNDIHREVWVNFNRSQNEKIDRIPKKAISRLQDGIWTAVLHMYANSFGGQVVSTDDYGSRYLGRRGNGDFSPLCGYTTDEIRLIGRELSIDEKFLAIEPKEAKLLGVSYSVLNEFLRLHQIDDEIQYSYIQNLHE